MKSKTVITMYECSSCCKKFKYESEKKRHEQSHIPQFECKVCTKKFSFLSALRRHEKQHERTGSVKCDICNGNFRDETLLKRHMQYAHKGTYTCTKCSSTFNSDQALRTHTKTHKPEAERRFHCSFPGCAKSFNFPHHLKHHELTHTDNKQHYCNICGKGFIQSHHLKIHMKKHEPESRLVCQVAGCNKKFTNEYARKRHLATHRNRPDSGVSSDSCDASSSALTTEEMILCSTCSQVISQECYKEHKIECFNTENPADFSVTSLEISIREISDEIDKTSDKFIDKENSVHSTATHNNNEDQCNRITAITNEYFAREIVQEKINETEIIDAASRIIINVTDANVCGNCKCIDSCIKMEDIAIEFRNDGIVKIENTFDIDIVGNVRADSSDLKDDNCNNDYDIENSVSFNSCKDVLGNCIVSGNGTMGEECLCAKMVADNGQIIAQEIEEITPCPKNTWLSQRL